MRMHHIGLKGIEQAAQLPGRDGIGKGRLMALLLGLGRSFPQRAQLAEAMDRHAAIIFLRRQPRLPNGCYGDGVSAFVQFAAQQLRLAMSAADKGRVMIAGDQNAISHLVLVVSLAQRLAYQHLAVYDAGRIAAIEPRL